MRFGAVAIGRNEGERLKQCLSSLSSAVRTVYVDSGSSDGSTLWARSQQVDVIDLDMNTPFTAARARNAGVARLRTSDPELSYVQLIDGDCELVDGWPNRAISFLEEHSEVAAVSGRLRERYPDRSIYNWLCEREWDGPSGQVRACGGIVMMRTTAFEAVGGFRDDLIAGEEPELCVRLRASGWRIWRLDTDMAFHDANIMRFSQWWRRTLRSGYAFAQGAYLHGATAERFRVWETRRAWFWGILLPLACVAVTLVLTPWGWTVWLIFPFQVLRQTVRGSGSLRERAVLSFFQVISRFPEALGQLKFLGDRLLRRQSGLIEY
jgi:GT2 family glycosyltransferase